MLKFKLVASLIMQISYWCQDLKCIKLDQIRKKNSKSFFSNAKSVFLESTAIIHNPTQTIHARGKTLTPRGTDIICYNLIIWNSLIRILVFRSFNFAPTLFPSETSWLESIPVIRGYNHQSFLITWSLLCVGYRDTFDINYLRHLVLNGENDYIKCNEMHMSCVENKSCFCFDCRLFIREGRWSFQSTHQLTHVCPRANNAT